MISKVASEQKDIFGIMSEYPSPELLLKAALAIRSKGFTSVDAFSPFPIEGLSEAIGFHERKIPKLCFFAGLMGGVAAYFMQWYSAVVSYPYLVGGMPENSVVSFIPITFELTILGAAFAAVLSMIILNKFPSLYHPVFNVETFQKRASDDGFFLLIMASDQQFETTKIRELLKETGAGVVYDVPA